jgi:hypothetical protein
MPEEYPPVLEQTELKIVIDLNERPSSELLEGLIAQWKAQYGISLESRVLLGDRLVVLKACDENLSVLQRLLQEHA